MISVSQVLLLRDSKTSHELGLALWAAMQEMASFYNADQPRVRSTCDYISEFVPEEVRRAGGAPFNQLPPEWDKELWAKARGHYTRTYDCSKIVDSVSQMLEALGRRPPFLVITDQELTPPPEWRYIVFDADARGQVTSIRPTDPVYWGDRSPRRVSTVKHRVRAAGLNGIGSLLGLHRCNNAECFLYSSIDSVTCLDAMVKLGAEHKLPRLAGYGFPPFGDPAVTQGTVLQPPSFEAR